MKTVEFDENLWNDRIRVDSYPRMTRSAVTKQKTTQLINKQHMQITNSNEKAISSVKLDCKIEYPLIPDELQPTPKGQLTATAW